MNELTDRLALELLANPTAEPMNDNDRMFMGGVLAATGYRGLRVVINPELTTDVEVESSMEVDRTWRERLFSWPWRPWLSMKTITYSVVDRQPDPNIYFVDGVLYCHPKLAAEVVRRTGASFEGPLR